MAHEPQRKIGVIDCPLCGESMPVKLNGRDTLNISCPWCGLSSYAKGGTEAHKIISNWIRKDGGAAPEAPAPTAPEPTPPAPSAAASVAKIAKHFAMSEL